MLELTRAQEWLFGLLLGSAELTSSPVGTRIYEAPAPQTAVLPYLTIDHRASTDVTVKRRRVSTQMLFAIDVVTEVNAGSSLGMEATYDAVDLALQGQSGTNRGIIIDQCQRDSNYTDWGIESGKPRKHVGALWRLFIREEP